MRAILLCLALVAGAAHADPVARNTSGDWVRFTQAECPADIAVKVDERFRDKMRKAYANIGGHDFVACWLQVNNIRALLFEDGDTGQVPESDVHEEPEA